MPEYGPETEGMLAALREMLEGMLQLAAREGADSPPLREGLELIIAGTAALIAAGAREEQLRRLLQARLAIAEIEKEEPCLN